MSLYFHMHKPKPNDSLLKKFTVKGNHKQLG